MKRTNPSPTAWAFIGFLWVVAVIVSVWVMTVWVR